MVVAPAQGLGPEQSPGPWGKPAHVPPGGVTSQVSNGPQVVVRLQHWMPSPLVVVVTEDVVVVVAGSSVVGGAGQLGPLPGTGHASQQLAHEPGVPPFATHEAASFAMLHFVVPWLVRQHVTNPGFFPQMERLAHFFTYPRQLRLTSVVSTCCAAQLT